MYIGLTVSMIAFGKPLGVLTVNVCLSRASAFLQGMIGKTLEKITVHTRSGEDILVERDKLTIVPNNASVRSAGLDQLVYREVPLTDANLKGWRLAVTLGPELSHPAMWGWRTPLLLLAGLLCSLGLAAFAASCVVNPVKRLSRAVVEVGNLKLDALIDVKTQVREIALLAGIIEKMRGALHRNQNRLEFLAYHDPVSGLLNHAGLSNEYISMRGDGGHIDLILIKIKNHTHISSGMGTAALGRIVARNIGFMQDEFPGCIPGCISENLIACLCETDDGLDEQRVRKLLNTMRQPYEENGIRCSVDICGSISPGQIGTSFDSLLRRGNGVLHYAEKTQSEGAVWYNPALLHDLGETLEDRGDAAQAIALGEFSVEFQPIVELATGWIAGVQVLAVWQHPQHGVVKQHKFVPILEKSGSIRDVGLFLISQSFEFFDRLKIHHPDGHKLSVCINLSLVQLFDPLFIERVAELQRQWSIDGSKVVFVVTRNVRALDDPQIVRVLSKLRNLGFRLSVDYAIDSSGLSKLTSVRSESLIIRPALQRNIEQPGLERTILRSVCRLAAELDMYSIALGVAHHAALASLIDCGCSHGIGPLFGDALSEQEFLDIYAENAALFTDSQSRGAGIDMTSA